MNISSVIISVKGDLEKTSQEIDAMQGCEVHLKSQEKGILIAVIEAESVQEEMQILEQINSLAQVIEAHLHYSYAEDELEMARQNLSNEISPILDDETPLEEVHYSGSVYHQMQKPKKGF